MSIRVMDIITKVPGYPPKTSSPTIPVGLLVTIMRHQFVMSKFSFTRREKVLLFIVGLFLLLRLIITLLIFHRISSGNICSRAAS